MLRERSEYPVTTRIAPSKASLMSGHNYTKHTINTTVFQEYGTALPVGGPVPIRWLATRSPSRLPTPPPPPAPSSTTRTAFLGFPRRPREPPTAQPRTLEDFNEAHDKTKQTHKRQEKTRKKRKKSRHLFVSSKIIQKKLASPYRSSHAIIGNTTTHLQRSCLNTKYEISIKLIPAISA